MRIYSATIGMLIPALPARPYILVQIPTKPNSKPNEYCTQHTLSTSEKKVKGSEI